MNYSEFSLKSAGFAAEGGTRGGSGLKWLGTAPSMEVTWGVSLVELKRAFRRLSARLSDEFGAGGAFVVLIARDDKLEITANRISEGLSASVVCPGRASVPFPVFRGVARILRSYRGATVRLTFSAWCIEHRPN